MHHAMEINIIHLVEMTTPKVILKVDLWKIRFNASQLKEFTSVQSRSLAIPMRCIRYLTRTTKRK